MLGIFLAIIKGKSLGFGLLVTLPHPHQDASKNQEFPTPLHPGYSEKVIGNPALEITTFLNLFLHVLYSNLFSIHVHIFFQISVNITGKLSKLGLHY